MAKPQKLKNGMYRLRIRIKDPLTNQWVNRSTTQKTIKLCTEWETETRNSVMLGISTEKLKLLDFFDLWYETYKKRTIGPDHQNKIMSVRKSIVEFFGENQYLNNIDRVMYQQFINFLGSEKNYAKETVRNKHTIFKGMFLEAIDLGYISRNPARNVKLIGRDTSGEKVKSLTVDQLNALTTVVVNSQEECSSKYLTLVQMYTGTRFQEVVGLTWKDINFEDNTIQINNAYDYKRSKEFTKTKTLSSIRVIDCPPFLFDILRDYKKHFYKNRKIVSIDLIAEEFLFPNELGQPITNKAANEYLAKKCKYAGIPKITTHAFRHTKTDTMVLAGNDIIYTSKQLGHATTNTTLKYYNQLNNDIRDKNKKIMNDFYYKEIGK